MSDPLLKILSDGQVHSGEELGSALGISRAAVWKRLQKLQELNVPLISVKGAGYKVDGGLDLLSREVVLDLLSDKTRSLIQSLQIRDEVGSTNQVALEGAGAVKSGFVCAAEQQTAGRGRRGRSWISRFGSSLCFSVRWEYAGGVATLEGLSLAVGVAISEGLQDAGVSDVQLKWPNDILLDGRKLGGVLIELSGDASGPCCAVVGIGLNVRMPSEEVAIDQPWSDLSAHLDSRVSRNRLLSCLLNRVMPLLDEFDRVGFGYFRDAWLKRDAYYGRPVMLMLGAKQVSGIERGVDSKGALLLLTEEGESSFSGGEISMRPGN